MTIQVEIKKHGKQQHEVLWFYYWNEGFKYCLGCIYNFEYRNEDFKWLFDFVSNLECYKLNVFSNCSIEEKEYRWRDEWDSYCNKKIIHSFKDIKNNFIVELNDISDSVNCNIEDVFKYINKITNIKFKIKRY